jgi:hypothetical protein
MGAPMFPSTNSNQAVSNLVLQFVLFGFNFSVGYSEYWKPHPSILPRADGRVLIGASYLVTRYGLGQHVWNISPDLIPLYLKVSANDEHIDPKSGVYMLKLQNFYVTIVLYTASILVVKATFLAQYYRIFLPQSKMGQWAFHAAAAFVILWSTAFLLIGIFTCRPISGFWNPAPDAVCIAPSPLYEINAAGNVTTDIIILILPIPFIGRLNLPRRQKYILYGIFSLGVL